MSADDLFAWKSRVRSTDPETSAEAAQSFGDDDITARQNRVLYELRKAGPRGLTDYELEEACRHHGSTFRTRRSELVRMGKVKDTGDRRVLAGSNRRRVVWALAEFVPDLESAA